MIHHPILTVYLVGVLLTAIAVGFTSHEDRPEDITGSWILSIFWPFMVIGATLYFALSGPFLLGRKLREWIK